MICQQKSSKKGCVKIMRRVAVVGDRDSVLIFKALGLRVFTPVDGPEARRIVDQIARENFGVIFITEQLAAEIPETIEKYYSSVEPAIILIPSNQGSLGIGMEEISKNVEKAVGANIL